MNINDILKQGLSHLSDGAELVVEDSWSQGRTVYGGLSTALLFQAIKERVPEHYLVKNINVNFVGPLFTEAPCQIDVQTLRVGKNVAQFIAYLTQNDKTCVVCQACFTRDRRSKITVHNQPTLHFAREKNANFFPPIPKVVPKFLKHFDLAIQEGGIPFTGRKTDHYLGWMRYKNPTTPVSEAAFIGLLDSYPPTLIQLLKWPAPASTINWNVEFFHPLPQANANDWFAYHDKTIHAEHGYGATEATIWSEDGRCLAISRQTVGVFD